MQAEVTYDIIEIRAICTHTQTASGNGTLIIMTFGGKC